MGVLFFGPNFLAPSQVWMRRMAEFLGDDLAVMVDFDVFDDGAPRKFRTVYLRRPEKGMFRLDKKISAWRAESKNKALLAEVLKDGRVSCSFVHFLVYAIKYRKVFAASGKPVYVHCHGWDVTPDLKRGKRGLSGSRVHPLSYARKVRNLPENFILIANSHATRQALLDMGVEERRVIVKHIGVPIPENVVRTPAPDGVTLRILFLGRLVGFKGPDLTIKAFSLAREKGSQAVLTIAGSGALREKCERMSEELGVRKWVRFLGAVDEQTADQLRKENDVFTAHSQKCPASNQVEAYGVAFVEAMAAGMPVVTGASGGIPEIVTNGSEGLLFEPGDVDAHANAFLQLERDQAFLSLLGRQAREKAGKHFCLEGERRHLRDILHLD